MRISLDLLLDLNLTEVDKRLLRGYVTKALQANENLQTIVKQIRVGVPKSIRSLHESRQAGGKARVASMSPKKRKLLARRAALARWNKIA